MKITCIKRNCTNCQLTIRKTTRMRTFVRQRRGSYVSIHEVDAQRENVSALKKDFSSVSDQKSYQGEHQEEERWTISSSLYNGERCALNTREYLPMLAGIRSGWALAFTGMWSNFILTTPPPKTRDNAPRNNRIRTSRCMLLVKPRRNNFSSFAVGV